MFSVAPLLMVLAVSHLSDDLALVGSFGFAMITAQLLYFVGIFGAADYQMTDYARAYTFDDYSRLKIYSSLAMVVSALAVLPWTDSTTEAVTVGLLVLYFVLCSIGELYQNVFFQNRRLDLYGKSLFYRSLLATLGYTVTMAVSRQVVLSLTVCLAATAAGLWWWAIRPARGFVARAPHHERHRAWQLARQCLPLFLIAIVSYSIQVVPRFTIKLMMDNEALGYFTLYTQPAFVILLVNQFIFRPVLDRYHRLIDSGDAAAFWRLKRWHLTIMVALTAAVMVFVYLFGVPIMRIVTGVDLAPVRTEMTLVVAYGGALMMAGLHNWTTTLIRKQKEAFYVHLAVVALSLVVTPLAVHYHGLMGASLSLVAVLLVLQTALAAVARHALNRGPFRDARVRSTAP